MAKNFNELLAKMSPEARAEVRRRADEALAEMPLQELRRARQLSQETLAAVLGATQPQISKIEHRTDLYVSTLRRYVEAMGGALDIVARFPDGSVRIEQFKSVALERTSINAEDEVFGSITQVVSAIGTTSASLEQAKQEWVIDADDLLLKRARPRSQTREASKELELEGTAA